MKTYFFVFLAIFIPLQMNAQVITTIAGIAGVAGNTGDGGPATLATINEPISLTVDVKGNIYIADEINRRIRKVDTSGIISNFAGTGDTAGFNGDGIAATAANLSFPGGIAVDKIGNLYIVQSARIRKVDTSGIITTIAGNGISGFSGDGGPATAAKIEGYLMLVLDQIGNIYFDDGFRIRMIDTNGIINTIAGNGSGGNSGDGGPATDAQIYVGISGMAFDSSGNFYFADALYCNIRKVNTSGIISLYAGTSTMTDCSFYGNGGPVTAARFHGPGGLVFDRWQNLYVCDGDNSVIRKINSAGIITTFAGTDTVAGYTGDGGPAINAKLNGPDQIVIDSAGNIYFTDYDNNCIRKISPGGGVINEIKSVAESKAIHIYPNPVASDGILHIDKVLYPSLYSIRSVIGGLIQEGSFAAGCNSIQLNIPPGFYLLEIDNKQMRQIFKIVK